MRPTKLMNHLSQDEVKQRMKASRDRDQFRRWQSIFLTGKGLQADMVAEYVGTTKGTIHQWIYLYNHDGPEGLTLRGRGGRRSGFLSLDEERALLAQVLPLTGKGRIIERLPLRYPPQTRMAKSNAVPSAFKNRYGGTGRV
jgi:hypothetical protein